MCTVRFLHFRSQKFVVMRMATVGGGELPAPLPSGQGVSARDSELSPLDSLL